MKVIHLNTSINESSAPYKLHQALCQAGIESKLLVLNGGEGLQGVERVPRNLTNKVQRKIAAIIRKHVGNRYTLQEYMPFTMLPFGMDISHLQEIQEADVIWLHWVCGDYMSPNSIQKLLVLKKPVLWTCHDNYPFTGGCHVRLGCDGYQEGCGKCPQLHSQKEWDISRKLIEVKKQKFQSDNLYIVSPSSWMDDNVSKSVVFKNHKHFILPNAIDTELFSPMEKSKAREHLGISQDRYVILVGLKTNEKIPYNGTEYLWRALKGLSSRCTEKMLNGKAIEIVMFGTEMENFQCDLPVHNLGYIHDKKVLVNIYAASDVYMVTSLEDSFNQTVAECMSCGTPVVAFRNGGIEDIIDHEENGYLAKYKDIDDLIMGIMKNWEKRSKEKAREKILRCFSYEAISNRFMDILKACRVGEWNNDGKK